ncbi:MAG: helix-turn-helix transcriptional regulator [Cyanobium sp.]
MRLSDLEAQSHYSRRALQYAFRERLNTTPKQWIREQRLTLALNALQREGQRPSIRAVALRCGYLSVSQFSHEFKVRFGVPPSQVRRL